VYFVAEVDLPLHLFAVAAAEGEAALAVVLPRHARLRPNHLVDEDVVAVVDVAAAFCFNEWVPASSCRDFCFANRNFGRCGYVIVICPFMLLRASMCLFRAWMTTPLLCT